MTTYRSIPTAARPYAPVIQPAYYPALDGLRAVAFLLVFAQHYLYIPWGWTGVDLFFVLSGFLITGILYDTHHELHGIRHFYLRRALRIFPLFFGVLILLVLAAPILHWEWNWHWFAWPLYLGNFLRGLRPITLASPLQVLADAQPHSLAFPNIQLYLGHFWSLCVEEQFYLIWPCLIFLIRDRRRLIFLCLTVIVLCPLTRQVASHTLPHFMLEQEVLYRWTPFRVDALLLGGILALLLRGPFARHILPVARILFFILTAVGLLWLGLHRTVDRFHYVYPAWRFTWGLSLIDLFAASLLILALKPGTLVFRLLNLRPLRRLGRISYGAYIFHDIFHLLIARWVTAHTGHWVLGTAAAGLTLTLILAWASYRWFESPFLRLKDRLNQSVSTAPPKLGPASVSAPVSTPSVAQVA